MSSMSRTIRRGMMFRGMNKQQKLMWRALHGGIKDPKKQSKAQEFLKAAK